MKSIALSTTFSLIANALNVHKPFMNGPGSDSIHDMTNENVRQSVLQNGIDISDQVHQIHVDSRSGTGYVWEHQVIPPDCVHISDVTQASSNRLMPGFAKKHMYSLETAGINYGSCTVSLALARPW